MKAKTAVTISPSKNAPAGISKAVGILKSAATTVSVVATIKTAIAIRAVSDVSLLIFRPTLAIITIRCSLKVNWRYKALFTLLE